MEVYKIFKIESARSLPNLPDGHPCKNIHGHSFKIKISVNGNVNEKTGFVMDFLIMTRCERRTGNSRSQVGYA